MAKAMRRCFWLWAWTTARHLAGWCYRQYKQADPCREELERTIEKARA